MFHFYRGRELSIAGTHAGCSQVGEEKNIIAKNTLENKLLVYISTVFADGQVDVGTWVFEYLSLQTEKLILVRGTSI